MPVSGIATTPINSNRVLAVDERHPKDILSNVQRKPNLLKYQLSRTNFIPTELDIGPRLGYTSFLEWLALFLQTSDGRRYSCVNGIDD